MKITRIKEIGNKPVYDITVDKSHNYALENGVITHNTGIYYSADNIWIVGRQQDKEGTEIKGWNFVINVEKSRYVKEKSKIPISVSYESGIRIWSGFLDLALDGGYVAKPSNGWYQIVDRETGELVGAKLREKEIANNSKIWMDMLTNTDFKDYIKNRFSISTKAIIHDDEPDEVETEE